MEILVKAYAKINLTLEILDKLPNGYHNIKSIFQAVDLYDTLSLSREKKGFYLMGSAVCSPKDNIITKAKEKLERFVEKELPCKIHLVKNLPICAGLGGGSSDAAATLVSLNELYNLHLRLEQLVNIGSKVGSDVPYFIMNERTALVEGTGEKVKPVKRKVSNFYILARPHKRLSTAQMYSLFDKTGKSFFEIAQELCPSIKKLEEYFKPLAEEFGMSGSGPTTFAGFNSYGKALRAVEGLGIEKFDGDFFICAPSEKTYDMFSRNNHRRTVKRT